MRALAVTVVLVMLLAGCGDPRPTIKWPEKTDASCHGEENGTLRCFDDVSGFTNPVLALGAGDGSGRTFVVQQDGRVLSLQDGEVVEQLFLDLRKKVATCHHEQGLLGLAFPPDFDAAQVVYATYTEKRSCKNTDRYTKGDVILARYPVVDGAASLADEERLLRVPEPFRNHNGGHILFGPDGMLYMGVGDGGDADDPLGTGRDPNDLLGSILRLDVSGPGAYAIPADNPFSDGGGAPEVWAYGLRNPWRFSFDAAGDLWIADVGQNCFEEINVVPAGQAGADLGWSTYEGRHPFDPKRSCAEARILSSNDASVIMPIHEYLHDDGACSVTGGFHAPAHWGRWAGMYLFSDFCAGTVWAVEETRSGVEVHRLLDSGLQVTSFGSDDDGNVYLMHWGGSIQRIEPA